MTAATIWTRRVNVDLLRHANTAIVSLRADEHKQQLLGQALPDRGVLAGAVLVPLGGGCVTSVGSALSLFRDSNESANSTAIHPIGHRLRPGKRF